jgi:flavin-dependent dehydrogenase
MGFLYHNYSYMSSSPQVLILGGGLAGLTAALHLARAGVAVTLIEKKSYPFHRVCGEYVSHEVRGYLSSLGFDPMALGAKDLRRLHLSSPQGKVVEMALPLGGFSLSRYAFDQALYAAAVSAGAEVRLETTVRAVHYTPSGIEVTLSQGQRLRAPLGIGAFGKRSSLDRQLGRRFFQERSPYLGVKFHAALPYPDDQVGLYNFQAGYCGVSQVENGLVNLCYLTTRDQLKAAGGSLDLLQSTVLGRNPQLADILASARSVFKQPLVINEVSFAPKPPVEHHLLMAGDAAGLITPLCGNGMAMAIQGAKLASEHCLAYLEGDWTRPQMEQRYAQAWRQQFGRRLWMGRQIQSLFQHEALAETAVQAMRAWPRPARWVIQQTHG